MSCFHSLDDVRKLISSHPNWPKPGITFYDIHPLMRNCEARAFCVQTLYERYKDKNIQAVVCLESRGYYMGIPLADKLGVPFVPFRKPKKLPGEVFSYSYKLEYGEDTIEVQKASLPAGTRVVLCDDLLATGGTAQAACALLDQCKAELVEFHCQIEIADLKGRTKLPADKIYTFWQF